MGIQRTLRDFKPAFTAYAACAYLLFQLKLSIAMFLDKKGRRRPANDPVPPAKLRYRVHGTLNQASYLKVGETVAQDVRKLCEIADRDFDSFTEILDFGSGCGRVIQNLSDRSGQREMYATDIDPDLVNWGRTNLSKIHWSTNGHQPPLPFNDSAFDLIYGISVFTHLDEEYQRGWLHELQRVARPGATLILTVHGKHASGMLDKSYKDEIRERGFLFITGPTGRFKLDELPDFYQDTYHSKEYIYKEWSTYFDIVDYVERGINNHQDAVLLRKPSNRS
jgi:ubiquinone/menaquinone biosynthesis C-methylase UbiE